MVALTDKKMLTVDQVGERLTLCRRAVLERIYSKDLPASNIGRKGKKKLWRVDPADLEKYILAGMPHPKPMKAYRRREAEEKETEWV